MNTKIVKGTTKHIKDIGNLFDLYRQFYIQRLFTRQGDLNITLISPLFFVYKNSRR